MNDKQLVKRVLRFGSTLSLSAKVLWRSLEASKCVFSCYHVLVSGRHGYYVFLLYSAIPKLLLDVASVCRCPVHPYPILSDDLDLDVWLINYVYSLPMSL